MTQNRFPLRTLVLMVLTLLAFLYFWFATHSQRQKRPHSVQFNVIGVVDGGAAP